VAGAVAGNSKFFVTKYRMIGQNCPPHRGAVLFLIPNIVDPFRRTYKAALNITKILQKN
jgi:hypothetical protein